MFKSVVCFCVLLACLEVSSKMNIADLLKERGRITGSLGEDDFIKKILVGSEEIPTTQRGVLFLRGRSPTSLQNDEINVDGDRKIIRTLHAILEEAKEKYGLVSAGHMNYLLQQINLFQFHDHPISDRHLPSSSKLFIEDLVEFIQVMNTMLLNRAQTRQVYLNFKELTTFLKSFSSNYKTDPSNFSLSIWRPFVTNISGFGLYRNPNDGTFYTKYIYNNETWKDVDLNHLETAAYVPQELLERLSEEISDEERNSLSIVMFVAENNKMFRRYTKVNANTDYVIGFAVPQFCKNNNLPVLKVFFKPPFDTDKKEWTEFGSDYDDWLENKCILPKVSYFGRFKSGYKKYYQSVKDNYCMPTKTTLRNSTINWRIVAVNEKNYPDRFCMNKNLAIPTLLCGSGGMLKNPTYSDLECYKHPTSRATEFLHTTLINCLYGLDCELKNLIFMYHRDASYVDIKLYFLIKKRIVGTDRKRYGIEAMANALERGLRLVDDKARTSNRQLTYITSLMHGFWECVVFNYEDRITIRPNFLHQTFRPFMGEVVGMAVFGRGFANYEILPLSRRNVSKSFESETSVEVAVYIFEFKKIFHHYNYTASPVDIFVVHNDKFKDSAEYPCNSRIVVVRPILPDKQSVKFRVYLKNLDGVNRGSGFWGLFEARNEFKMVCLTESQDGKNTMSLFASTWKM